MFLIHKCSNKGNYRPISFEFNHCKEWVYSTLLFCTEKKIWTFSQYHQHAEWLHNHTTASSDTWVVTLTRASGSVVATREGRFWGFQKQMSSLDRDTLIEQSVKSVYWEYSYVFYQWYKKCLVENSHFLFFGFQTVYFFYQKPVNKAAYVEVHLAKV